MNAARTPKQRQEGAANQKRLRERIGALRSHREHTSGEVASLSDEMAAGKDGARAAALNRADDLRAIDLEIEAVERMLRAEEAAESADLPFVEAEHAAAEKKRLQVERDKVQAAYAACDDLLRETVKGWAAARQCLMQGIAAGLDGNLGNQLQLREALMPALAAAGLEITEHPDIGKFGAPVSLGELAAARLRA